MYSRSPIQSEGSKHIYQLSSLRGLGIILAADLSLSGVYTTLGCLIARGKLIEEAQVLKRLKGKRLLSTVKLCVKETFFLFFLFTEMGPSSLLLFRI